MMTDQRKSYSRAAVSTSLAFLGIVVMSMTMRSGATSIGPLLGHISQAITRARVHWEFFLLFPVWFLQVSA